MRLFRRVIKRNSKSASLPQPDLNITDLDKGHSVRSLFENQNRSFWCDWRKTPVVDKRVVVTELTGNPFLALDITIPATVFAAHHHASALFVRKKKKGAACHLHSLIGSFGPHQFESMHELVQDHWEDIEAEAQAIFKTIKSPNDLLSLQYRDVPVGDLIYDTAMRHKPWLASLRAIDERVLKEIVTVIEAIRAVDVICERYDVRAAVYSRVHTTYLGGLARAFAKRGIDIVIGSFRLIRHRQEAGLCLEHFMVMRPAFVNRLLETSGDELREAASAFYKNYFRPDTTETTDLASDQTWIRQSFCRRYQMDESKPVVFVMLHAFNDFPHTLGPGLFLDYCKWFEATLAFTRQMPDVNWVFKEHPDSTFYPNDLDLPKIFAAEARSNVIFLDATHRIPREALAKLAHAIVTCSGTSGLEFACRGLPTLLAAKSYFTGWGFCQEPKDVETYFAALSKISEARGPTQKAQELAKVILYLTTADTLPPRYGLLPPLRHGGRISPDLSAILQHMIKHFPSSHFIRCLSGIQAFASDLEQDHYLDPEVFPMMKAPRISKRGN